jgi:hypothetical protein
MESIVCSVVYYYVDPAAYRVYASTNSRTSLAGFKVTWHDILRRGAGDRTVLCTTAQGLTDTDSLFSKSGLPYHPAYPFIFILQLQPQLQLQTVCRTHLPSKVAPFFPSTRLMLRAPRPRQPLNGNSPSDCLACFIFFLSALACRVTGCLSGCLCQPLLSSIVRVVAAGIEPRALCPSSRYI